MSGDRRLRNIAPLQEYTRRLDARRAELTAAARQHVTFGNLRVLLLIVLLATTVAWAFGGWSWWWWPVPAGGFVWATRRLDRAVKARTRLELAVGFYERALTRLAGQWKRLGAENGQRFLDDEHVYTRDLDVFGEGSVFELLNLARTHIGESTLAVWLKVPALPAVVRARQEAVAELAPRVDLREELAVLGEDARAVVRTEALADWAERRPRLPSSAVPVWVWVASAAGLAAVAAGVVLLADVFGQIAIDAETLAILRISVLADVAVAGAVTWWWRATTVAILGDVADAARDLNLLSDVVRRLEEERFTAAALAGPRSALDAAGHPASHEIARLQGLISLVDSRDSFAVRLAGPLVLWDVHLAHAIERWRRTSGPAVRGWLSAVGDIEALSSLSGYRYDHPDDVFPELTEETCFEGEGLGHPLLPDAVMVRNDVSLSGAPRVLVVSGSNMSGKSTLLRTVGVNAVLAQAGAPVRARRLRMSSLAVGASMRAQDSLQNSVSRFYAEATRLGRIVERAKQAPPVLFLLDELLSGTNSHDRRIGAEAIVRTLVDRGAIGLITTHDLSLAEVAVALGPGGANVHFEDTFDDGGMRFDYVMRPGVVQKSNALALLRSVGVDVTCDREG